MAAIPVLNSKEKERLGQLLRAPGTPGKASHQPGEAVADFSIGYVCYVGTTAVPARVGGVPGSAELPLYEFDDDDNLVAVTDANGQPVTQPVLNLFEAESPTNAYLPVLQEISSGRLLLTHARDPDEDDGDFPAGSIGCGCNNCLEGSTIPDGTVCCVSHPKWLMSCPVTGTPRQLKYLGGDSWATDPFDVVCGGGTNTYRWRMTPSVSGTSTLTLTLVTNGGCDAICLIYVRGGFSCKCANTFALDQPGANWANIGRDTIRCTVCVAPATPGHGFGGTIPPCNACTPAQEIDPVIYVQFSGTTVWEADHCDGVDGTYALHSRLVPGDKCPHSSGGHSLPCGLSSDCTWHLPHTPNADPDVLPFLCQSVAGWNCNPSFPDGDPLHVATLGITATVCGAHFYVALSLTRGDGYASQKAIYECQNFNCADSFTCTKINEDVTDSGGVYCRGSFCHLPDAVTIYMSAELLPAPTSSGVCGGGCTPPAAPSDPEGACCLDGDCFDMSQTLCTDFGGSWHTTDAACNTACAATGACCTGNGISFECDQLTAADCALVGGSFAGNGTDCAGGGPCQPGACCNGTVCSQSYAFNCAGTFITNGNCLAGNPPVNPCEPSGACCDGDVCTITNADDCTGPKTYLGNGTTCNGAPCAGACCIGPVPFTSCDSTYTNQAACEFDGGTWYATTSACQAACGV